LQKTKLTKISYAAVLALATITLAVQVHGQRVAPGGATEAVNDQSQLAADWPQYGFDPQHTSFNPNETLLGGSTVSMLQVAWQYFFPCSTYSSPVVVSGVLYTGSYCGDFEALDAATGQTLWTQYLGGVVDSAAVANGVVYVTAKEAATLFAFNASTGASLWTAQTGGWIYSNPTVANGIVYVGAADGKLYAFDAGSGTELWTTASLNIIESPSIENGIAYVGASDGHLFALDAASGVSIWTADMGGSNATPAVANGVVYEGGLDDHLYAFDAGTGAILWTGIGGGSSPAVANGMVYIGSEVQKRVYAFDASGCASPPCSPAWTAPTKGIVTAAPTVANGVVYAVAWDRYLYAFDASRGKMLWTYTAASSYNGCICPSPSVVNGVLYVGVTFGFQLYAFDLGGGTFVTTTSSANPSRLGQAVTFTTTVTAILQGMGKPTGTVTFKDGALTLGTGTLTSGQASFTTSKLNIGIHKIRAEYSGDSTFNPHKAIAILQKVVH
jgi:eukaryotic-like serine/threonine-protein kinase